MKPLFLLASIGSVFGGLYLLGGILLSRSAPQEAAAGAYACAFAVVPYVLARVNQLWRKEDDDRKRHAELVQLLRTLAPAGAAETAQERAQPTPPAPPAHATAVGLAKAKCTKCGEANVLTAVRCGGCGALLDSNAAN